MLSSSSGAGATQSVSLPWWKLSPSRSFRVCLDHFLCRVGLCAHCPSFVLEISFRLVQVSHVTVWEFIYELVCSVVSGKCCFLKLICDPYRSYFLPPRLSSQIPKSRMEGCDRILLRLMIRLWVMYWSMVRACVCHEESFLVMFLRQTTVGHFHRACDPCSLSNLTVSYNNKLLVRCAH